MVDEGTGTTASIRRGTGIIRSLFSKGDVVYARIRRDSGTLVDLSMTPDLAAHILKRYGYSETPTFTSVQPLMDQKVAYVEDRCGMLVDLKPMDN